MDSLPSFLEDHISQIPALQLLQNLGWQYLTPEETVSLRGGKRSGVILDGVLIPQLRKLNKIRFKGDEYEFSEANVQSALQALKDVLFDGLVRTNEKIYDLLLLGKSLAQTIDGDTKSFPLFFIDWNPKTFLTNNVFHVTEEFEVERTASHETRRPDIVLFVNGIPLAVIEFKRPDLKEPIEQAISQHLRNQRDDEIPKLFLYGQLLLAVSKNEAKYGTTGTALKFWSVWKEDVDAVLSPILNTSLSKPQKDRLFKDRYAYVAEIVDFKEYEAKIQKLIDTHVTTGTVEKVTTLVNIFDKDAFLKEIEKLESLASKADTIAHRTKRTITERMDEDPAFYRKFSELLEDAIRAFREKRLADRDYLAKVVEVAEAIRTRSGDSLPSKLRNHDVAKAFYGVLLEPLGRHATDAGAGQNLSALAALRIDEIIQEEKIVSWTSNADVQNRMKNRIEDCLHDLKQEMGLSLSFEDIDLILEKCLDIARRRYPG